MNPSKNHCAVDYAVNEPITVNEFLAVLRASTLGDRRPLDDRACIEGMVANASLIVTARVKRRLVGVARSVTDFSYCCYLSDLAVDSALQRLGIGRRLIELTREHLGPQCKILLLSAPAAVDYYPRIGFRKHQQAWILGPDDPLG